MCSRIQILILQQEVKHANHSSSKPTVGLCFLFPSWSTPYIDPCVLCFGAQLLNAHYTMLLPTNLSFVQRSRFIFPLKSSYRASDGPWWMFAPAGQTAWKWSRVVRSSALVNRAALVCFAKGSCEHMKVPLKIPNKNPVGGIPAYSNICHKLW